MNHPSVSDGLDDGPTLVSKKLVDKTGNQINVIYPYKTKGGGWSFDDEEVGLHGEPFVAGIPEIINSIVGKRRKFTAYISHSPIPEYTGHLRKMRGSEFKKLVWARSKSEVISGWYILEETGMAGWLCPATLKYFKDYPDDIYFKIE
jgi:hypothetical protein